MSVRAHRRLGLALAVVLLAGAGVAAALSAGGETAPARAAGSSTLVRKAIARDRASYAVARRAHARVHVWSGGRAFTVFSPGTRRPAAVIVTLHGFKSTAFEQYAEWAPYARRHGYGLLSLQWRTGFDRRAKFLSGGAIYSIVSRALRSEGVRRGRALLHGYSSAAFRTYGVTALDRRRHRLFGVTIANAGAPNPGYPSRELVRGRHPFRGSTWVMFCGGRDPHPDFTGCPAMRRARSYVRARGGAVARFIVDPRAGHSGFMQRRSNVESALAVFAKHLGG